MMRKTREDRGTDERQRRRQGRERGGQPMSSFDFHVKATEDLTFKKGQQRRTQTQRDWETDSGDL